MDTQEKKEEKRMIKGNYGSNVAAKGTDDQPAAQCLAKTALSFHGQGGHIL